MLEYIAFKEHRVASPEGVVFFSPPYLFERKVYEAVFTLLEELHLDVIEWQREDLEMTRDTAGMRAVADVMTEKLQTLRGEPMFDVGLSLGAGFTALAREESGTTPVGRLILSPAPDPVTPWDEGFFQKFLDAANGGAPFVCGAGNYAVLCAIKEANEAMKTGVKTSIIAEAKRGINNLERISNWAHKMGAQLEICLYAHGTFRNKRSLPLLVKGVLEQLKVKQNVKSVIDK